MPPPLPLTSERLERHGLFLIEDGQTIFLWVGRDAVPQLIHDVFGLEDYAALRGGKCTLPYLDNPMSEKVNAIVQKTREMRRGVYYPHLYVVKDDGEPALRLWALSALIHDRHDVLPSYQQFMSSLKDKVCIFVFMVGIMWLNDFVCRLMVVAGISWWFCKFLLFRMCKNTSFCSLDQSRYCVALC